MEIRLCVRGWVAGLLIGVKEKYLCVMLIGIFADLSVSLLSASVRIKSAF